MANQQTPVINSSKNNPLNKPFSGLSCFYFPWRDHNRVQLLVNAESFYPAMLSAISSAQHVILLEMYLVKSGDIANDFISAFLAAADRGVQVYLLLDGFGCRELSQVDIKRLQHKNIHITFYNPLNYGQFLKNFFRDHRKILVVDGHTSFIGGAGITDDFVTKSPRDLGWRETMIEIKGESTRDWVQLFSEVWDLYSDIRLPDIKYSAPDMQFSQTCRVICAMGHSRLGIKRSLVKRIKNAEQRVWISTAYFLPSLKIRRELVRAAKRGVDVRLLLPSEKTDHPSVRQAGRRYYYRLLNAGVVIEEYQPRFLHQKLMLCDQWVSIGSSNIDRWNFRWNLEANQEIEDSTFVNQIVNMLEDDFAQAKNYELETWKHRPLYSRIQEWFWGQVDKFLDRFIRL